MVSPLRCVFQTGLTGKRSEKTTPGWFHGFFNEADEHGAYPVAVVSDLNGEVRTVRPHWIRFTDPIPVETEEPSEVCDAP